ncbi:glycosyltransferase [Massilia forsythiae]|uniref:Glycosyltransferase n=1 Tax=Massilia forsythiae TaxID=2728020 RepID=A0A7Z2VZH5_9BURK|nr:glycosyltransferase [Massilia forsythiae]QJE02296.1 glycosyltransferase [Massilia forsythiae]
MGAKDSAGVAPPFPDDPSPSGEQPGVQPASRLIVHLVDTFDGAHRENGLLELIRHLPRERYRHAVVCLHERGGDQAGALTQGVEIVNLHKGEGRDPLHYLRMFRALRRLRPDLVHTRNRAGLLAQVVAALAGVPLRVHAEHRRALHDSGGRLGARLLRKLLYPLIDHVIAVSCDLEQWLVDSVGAEPARVSQIANGVDSVQFHPRLGPAAAVGPPGFMQDNVFVIGCVGAMDEHGGHATLVEAFLRLIASPHPAHARLRLLIAGEGPERAECQALLNRAGAAQRAWLPGARADTAQLLRAMDLFVLPAPAEDRANAILEAMASGLPVVANAVGGNTELVHPGFTGILVPPLQPELLAAAIADYCRIPEMALRHGARARSQVIARHSIPAMARDYLAIYDNLTDSLAGSPDAAPAHGSAGQAGRMAGLGPSGAGGAGGAAGREP